MTVISPYQRQLVFTRSFSGTWRSPKSKSGFLNKVRAFWEGAVGNRALPVHGICAVCGIVAVAIFIFGIQAVLISFRKETLAGTLRQARLEREGLELQSTQLLSPEALRAYADMVQLYQPSSIRYLSAEVSVMAQRSSVREATP